MPITPTSDVRPALKIFRSPRLFAAWRAALPSGRDLGFVPTMGALHAGHLALVERALRENDQVAASIFVNPIQFGPREDLKRYPRPFDEDVRRLRAAGVSALFAPTPENMYTPGFATRISVEGLTDTLCGAPTSRGPGHFTGVATVVAKLFNIVRPRRAYFGMKDYQQLRVIERMTEDLNLGPSIVRCPTVREADGLAMSSRNAYLSPVERSAAARLYAALQHGRKLLASRKPMTSKALCQRVSSFLAAEPLFQIEYVELVDPVTLQRLSHARRPALLAIAARLGSTRLIDNILVR